MQEIRKELIELGNDLIKMFDEDKLNEDDFNMLFSKRCKALSLCEVMQQSGQLKDKHKQTFFEYQQENYELKSDGWYHKITNERYYYLAALDKYRLEQ